MLSKNDYMLLCQYPSHYTAFLSDIYTKMMTFIPKKSAGILFGRIVMSSKMVKLKNKQL
jgi:hypothetical protein